MILGFLPVMGSLLLCNHSESEAKNPLFPSRTPTTEILRGAQADPLVTRGSVGKTAARCRTGSPLCRHCRVGYFRATLPARACKSARRLHVGSRSRRRRL